MKRNGTVKSKVLKTIINNPDRHWSVAEVAEVTKQKPANVSYHLRSLEKSGQVVKVGPGRFQAPGAEATVVEVVKVVPSVTSIDTDAITARLWSEVLRTDIDASTVETLLGIRRVVADEVAH